MSKRRRYVPVGSARRSRYSRDCANLVTILCSPKAGWINGQLLPQDRRRPVGAANCQDVSARVSRDKVSLPPNWGVGARRCEADAQVGPRSDDNRPGTPFRSFHMILLQRDRAQGLVEYGLIIALVAVIAIAGLIIFGPAVSSLLSNLGGSV